ncbi:hypothetical protein BGZ81_004799, partial [Podila clonocystis]
LCWRKVAHMLPNSSSRLETLMLSRPVHAIWTTQPWLQPLCPLNPRRLAVRAPRLGRILSKKSSIISKNRVDSSTPKRTLPCRRRKEQAWRKPWSCRKRHLGRV